MVAQEFSFFYLQGLKNKNILIEGFAILAFTTPSSKPIFKAHASMPILAQIRGLHKPESPYETDSSVYRMSCSNPVSRTYGYSRFNHEHHLTSQWLTNSDTKL